MRNLDLNQSQKKRAKTLLKKHKPPAAAKSEELMDKNTTLNIAITGESFAGKSTFINAFRGIDDEDERAAPTGVVESPKDPIAYFHPEYPNVILWDLPGIGTIKFPADEYVERVGFEKFDFFIIISDTRLRANDVKLAQEIQRMKKKFYFVRSKIDNNIYSEKRKRDFSAERTLAKIRENCVQGLQTQGIKTPQVFLVSSFEPHPYDFPLLFQTFERELPAHKQDALLLAMSSMELDELSRKTTDDQFQYESLTSIPGVRENLENNDTAAAAARIQEYLERQNNIPLNIAITGETGSGKSTFVNALRGMSNGDEGAAPTGVTETTLEPAPYPHPNYPNVTLWDLPGIGTTKFPADEYLKLVGFEKFDFFIIISDTRFRENDVKLAQEIQKMKKKFYFVRSKIDNDIRADRRKRDFSEEKALTKIREDCVQGLRGLDIESPQVFLVSSFELHLYDFSLLQQTLQRELPKNKRDALLFVMPNFNPEIIIKKKETLKSRIKYYATLSAAVAAVPLPGLSIAVDAVVLVGAVTHYVHAFGLDIPSLKRLSDRTGVPYNDLQAVIISPLAAAEITKELLLKVVTQVGRTASLIGAEETSRFIPLIGIPVAMGLSFTTAYKILNIILNQLADDAQRVFEKTLTH